MYVDVLKENLEALPKYRDINCSRFDQKLKSEHGTLCYSIYLLLLLLLLYAGLDRLGEVPEDFPVGWRL